MEILNICLSVIHTSQGFAEIILCKFEVFWSPLTNLIIETNQDEEILPQTLWGFSGGTNAIKILLD